MVRVNSSDTAAIPALRSLTKPQYQSFRHVLLELIKADDQIDLFEWSLNRILQHSLSPQFGKASPPAVKYQSLGRLQPECQLLLSSLAHVGHDDPEQIRLAFDHGAMSLHLKLGLLSDDKCELDRLDRALGALNLASPRLKRQLLIACAACVSADAKITAQEAELFRAISDTLGCPMPPLLPGQPLS